MRQPTPQPARHPNLTAQATKLAHLIFTRPDLDRAETFLRDFGLTVVERTQRRLPAGVADHSPYRYRVHRAPEEKVTPPGGGEQVELAGPSGCTVEAMWNQAKAEPLPDREPRTLNVGGQGVRRQDTTADLVFKPTETFTEFPGVQGFAAGYPLSTGAPAVCAPRLPKPAVVGPLGLLPAAKRWGLAPAIDRPDPRVGELPVGYVQLKNGAAADEKDLVAHLDEAIAERAARPRAVHVIDSMQMIAVSKHFKPALGRREAEQALSAALRDTGFADATVRRHADPDLPQNVIAIRPSGADADAAAEVLGAYLFPITITTD
jgi:catechol 2,3-dioxygenase-like lactoylglutathione lyase family enzyme